MPSLDLSAVVTSPAFQDSFTVTRRTQTVGNDGFVVITPAAPVQQYGVVYPSNESDLKRLPDAQLGEKAITIISRYALRGPAEVSGTDYQPDVITWHGDSFVVRKIEDWSGYAAGFVMAIASSIDSIDAPPVTQ